jgi:phenylpropionate dioxygenase-like ring-hydroxylating dioxygenase large terminal subunit
MLITGVEHFRRYWYPVAFASAVAPGPVARRLLGTDLVLWAGADGIVAAVDRCPHREATLSPGWVDSCRLVCPYHGWEYGLLGRAERIPQLADGAPIPPTAQLRTFATTVRYGVVWVCLEDDPVGGIPDLPEYGRAGWRVIPEYEWSFDCSAAHLIENNFDPAHVAFVHRKTFGTPAKARFDPPAVTRTGFGFVAESRVGVEGRHGEAGATQRITTAELHLPFGGVIRIGYPDGLVHIMFKGCCPVDDGHTRLVQFVVRNDTETDVPAADIVDFDDRVEAEDQVLLATVPTAYPTDLTANTHLRVDRSSIELRRLYAEMIAGAWTPEPSRPGHRIDRSHSRQEQL